MDAHKAAQTRAVGAAAQAGHIEAVVEPRTAANATRGSGPNAQTYNEAMAIAERSSILERVKLSKGC